MKPKYLEAIYTPRDQPVLIPLEEYGIGERRLSLIPVIFDTSKPDGAELYTCNYLNLSVAGYPGHLAKDVYTFHRHIKVAIEALERETEEAARADVWVGDNVDIGEEEKVSETNLATGLPNVIKHNIVDLGQVWDPRLRQYLLAPEAARTTAYFAGRTYYRYRYGNRVVFVRSEALDAPFLLFEPAEEIPNKAGERDGSDRDFGILGDECSYFYTGEARWLDELFDSDRPHVDRNRVALAKVENLQVVVGEWDTEIECPGVDISRYFSLTSADCRVRSSKLHLPGVVYEAIESNRAGDILFIRRREGQEPDLYLCERMTEIGYLDFSRGSVSCGVFITLDKKFGGEDLASRFMDYARGELTITELRSIMQTHNQDSEVVAIETEERKMSKTTPTATQSIKAAMVHAGKAAAVDQFAEMTLDIIVVKLGQDHPILGLLDEPIYREAAKAVLSIALIYGVDHLGAHVPKSGAIRQVAELQLSASTVKLLTEVIAPLRGELLNLGNVAETVLELDAEDLQAVPAMPATTTTKVEA